MANDFRLAASLSGHEDDVRAVAFPSPQLVLSASRDATVRSWQLSSTTSTPESHVSSQGSAFVNALTFLPPQSEYPEGLVIFGGKDTIIEVRIPSKAAGADSDALLLGHTNNVCALAVSPSGKLVISGSWDGTARVWKVGAWDSSIVLEGHQASVWAVLALNDNTILTGSADKLIRVFNGPGKLVKTIRGHPDVIRALCAMPQSNAFGASFASAGNDGVIRLWNLNGEQVGELHGHENFIYSLAVLPSGELVSSGEDRTVRIWKDGVCIQTISHPAISVWGVAVCEASGDIVSGASDRIVRVFTRQKERFADEATTKEFEEAVSSSAIPQQQMGDINKEKLPGPEFLQQKSGTKEGQVVMIHEHNGAITAHQWSTSTNTWISVGTVVDAVGSSGKKKDYLGQDYDYVFDVDIEEGKPPLKLPYNLSQNPYEAATKFIEDNELPMTYLDQVADFIRKNTQGATIGQTQAAGPDPLSGDRYQPDDVSTYQATPDRPKVIPQKTYLSITQASVPTILRKIEEFNAALLSEGNKEYALNPHEVSELKAIAAALQPGKGASLPSHTLDVAVKVAALWPAEKRLPGLDLLRLVAASGESLALYKNDDGLTVIDLLEESGVFSAGDRPNNVMLAVRTLANLFNSAAGVTLMQQNFNKVFGLVSRHASDLANRNLSIACMTLMLNYSVSIKASGDGDSALSLLERLIDVIQVAVDSETVYRALVAAGTLITVDEDTKLAAKELLGLKDVAVAAEGKVKEPRVKSVSAEIRSILST